MKTERLPEGEVSFLAVASGQPDPERVIEPAICELDSRTFYRQKYPAGGQKRRFCRDCEEKIRRRAAMGNPAPAMKGQYQPKRRAS